MKQKMLKIDIPYTLLNQVNRIAQNANISTEEAIVHYINIGLEYEEDAYLSKIADERADGEFITSEEFWSQVS